jgi:RNA polymerase sigma-70 factor, ECF subfamily
VTTPSPDPLGRSLDGLPDAQKSLDLLAQAQNGDRAALESLVRRYQERLHRIVRIQLGDSPLRRQYDSLDIVQRTFTAALPKIADLRPRSAAGLLQWLAIIATNQIRDAHDREYAAKRNLARQVDLCAEPPNRSRSLPPDERTALAEVREMLDQEVAALPDDQRRVVLLRDYCGEDWDRIAEELEREHGAARQLHQRAWIRLRQALKPRLE